MFQKKDFEDFTIGQLLQKVWDITYAFENNDKAKHFFWLPLCKQWCVEFLREKWIPSYLPSLKFVLKRVEKQHFLYCPGSCIDEEKFKEFLVKVKEIRKKIRMRIHLEHAIWTCFDNVWANVFNFECLIFLVISVVEKRKMGWIVDRHYIVSCLN